ncbi:MAG: hypothetical protein ACO3JL_16490, partial [Myxococcota bacterium]
QPRATSTASNATAPPSSPPRDSPLPTAPTGLTVAASSLRVVAADEDVPVPTRGAGRGKFLAAMVAVGTLVGAGAVLLLPSKSGAPDTAEPASEVVAADQAPEKADPSATTEPLPPAPAAPAEASAQPASAVVATTDPAGQEPAPQASPGDLAEPATEEPTVLAPETAIQPASQRPQKRQKPSRVSAAQRAEAKQALREAQEKWAAGDESGAYEGYKKAFQLNPKDPTPLQPIAFYHKKNGDLEKSCNAIRRLIQLKGAALTAAQQRMLGQQFCAGAE